MTTAPTLPDDYYDKRESEQRAPMRIIDEAKAIRYRAEFMGLQPTIAELQSLASAADELQTKIASGELMVVKTIPARDICERSSTFSAHGGMDGCEVKFRTADHKRGLVKFCPGCGAKIIE